MIKETTDRSLSNNESDQRFMQLKVLKKEKKSFKERRTNRINKLVKTAT